MEQINFLEQKIIVLYGYQSSCLSKLLQIQSKFYFKLVKENKVSEYNTWNQQFCNQKTLVEIDYQEKKEKDNRLKQQNQQFAKGQQFYSQQIQDEQEIQNVLLEKIQMELQNYQYLSDQQIINQALDCANFLIYDVQLFKANSQLLKAEKNLLGQFNNNSANPYFIELYLRLCDFHREKLLAKNLHLYLNKNYYGDCQDMLQERQEINKVDINNIGIFQISDKLNKDDKLEKSFNFTDEDLDMIMKYKELQPVQIMLKNIDIKNLSFENLNQIVVSAEIENYRENKYKQFIEHSETENAQKFIESQEKILIEKKCYILSQEEEIYLIKKSQSQYNYLYKALMLCKHLWGEINQQDRNMDNLDRKMSKNNQKQQIILGKDQKEQKYAIDTQNELYQEIQLKLLDFIDGKTQILPKKMEQIVIDKLNLGQNYYSYNY
ncbi:hypothetical protein PPERSA_04181 [Pseudocohnilembus persalinus]|uniref:Uncharacterized protein n=1 Tax=Pseudocohnilembus persalinus TaxID=266149 RepID=A0A0V0QN59_PSEPJ|nr:hypothetical protein PPERSA_04181 [Pseudocohnilembus persalinus]|eukprot:KRX03629.1 hypothetical protein PPERSA_04181 [Pseudocohnilembus persalinus]